MRTLVAAILVLMPSLLFGAEPSPPESPFQAIGSGQTVIGELVQADFIRRTGQFRTAGGELVDFRLPPYGAIYYLHSEADLRDVPLGTQLEFRLMDKDGDQTKTVILMRDQFSRDGDQDLRYRVDEIQEQKLAVTPVGVPDAGRRTFRTSEFTRFWKDEKAAKRTDLAVGDEIRFNLAGSLLDGVPLCADVWIGANTQAWATKQQREKHHAFVKLRGLPGRIDKTEGNKLFVTLYSGDAKSFNSDWMKDFGVGREMHVAVANDELRTWNPPVDKERGQLLEIQTQPAQGYGTSGVALVFTVGNMLEGLRKGRTVRVFGAGWPIKDQFYAESLMGYGYGRVPSWELNELTPQEYPTQYPFRTEYGNRHLPWYKVDPNVAPPRFSEHVVYGELLQVDSEKRTGRFRSDGSGTENFTLIPAGTVRYLNADAQLADLPLGTRCRFHLYQDDQGAFTLASFVSDEYSHLASQGFTYRIVEMRLSEGKLLVAKQLPPVKNYNGDMEQPPDVGAATLLVSPETKLWKGEQEVKLSDLQVGDVILVNLSGEQSIHPAHCREIWIGVDTHKAVTEAQAKRNKSRPK